MPHTDDLRGSQRTYVTVDVPAATGTVQYVLLDALVAVTVESVEFVAALAHTGDATNTKNINIDSRDSSFDNPTEEANRDYGAGTDDTQGDVVSVWAPTGTAGDLTAGAYLSAEIEQVGTGIRLAGTFVTTFRNRE